MKKALLGLGLSSLLLTGCASVISDSNYPVSISSDPSGAAFEIRDRNNVLVYSGTTPDSVKLDAGAGFFKSQKYQVRFTHNGEESVMPLSASIDGWYFGNILLGGFIGMLVIDPVTGAMWSLPERTHGVLPDSQLAEGEDGIKTVQILTIEQIPTEMRDQLVPLSS